MLGTRARGTLWSLVGAVLLLQGLLVPMLESTDDGAKVVLESDHSAATCAVGHDHSICVQSGSNRAVAAPPVQHHVPAFTVAFAALALPRLVHSVVSERGHSPRAPPVA
jgi:hypothetical protein